VNPPPAVDIAAIVAGGAPVLCIDTCSLLDIVRDPRRDTARPHEAVAAHDLVAAAEDGRLTILIAPQVVGELGDNRAKVEGETTAALEKLREMARRIDGLVAAFGVAGTMDTSHLAGHVDRASALLDRWLSAAFTIVEGPEIAARAFDRVRTARTPSRQGKENMKDCAVIETYLEVVAAFRSAGGTTKAVFVSANTNDYAGDVGVVLKGDLAAEFAALELEYEPNLAAAKHALGL
jgi:hypothetical protein